MGDPAELILARQPVFDRDLKVIGYELLFRPTSTASAAHVGNDDLRGELMTAHVILNSIEIGIERVVGDRLAFCNASRGTLVGEIPVILPPERTVVEVLESVVIDDEVMAGCRRLADDGYELALDDFTWYDGAEELLELASLVKIDLTLVDDSTLPELLERCRSFGVRLLAEKIETDAELETCLALGFDLFQGYVLSRPQIIAGQSLDGSRLAILRIASQLRDPDARISAIERIVRTDPALSYRLLRVASIGSAHGMRRTVRSLRDALVLVGWRRLQACVTLMLLVGHDAGREETLSTTLVRARLCELLAERLRPGLADEGFAAGLLSCLDLLLRVPLATALAELSIDREVEAAVLRREGLLGTVIDEATFLQTGGAVSMLCSGLGPEDYQACYLDAVMWADETVHSLLSADVSDEDARRRDIRQPAP